MGDGETSMEIELAHEHQNAGEEKRKMFWRKLGQAWSN
jgi:hypothetical protein